MTESTQGARAHYASLYRRFWKFSEFNLFVLRANERDSQIVKAYTMATVVGSKRLAGFVPSPLYANLMEKVVEAKKRWKMIKRNPSSSTEAKRTAKAIYLKLKRQGKDIRSGKPNSSGEKGENASIAREENSVVEHDFLPSSDGKKRKRSDAQENMKKIARHTHPETPPTTKFSTFSEAPFCSNLQDTLKASYSSPTPAQSRSWPVILAGHDLVCIARTGSGKTCAFLLPILHRIVGPDGSLLRGSSISEEQGLRGSLGRSIVPSPTDLILAPTRELAIQISQELSRLGRPLGVRSVCLCGGMPKHNQINSLNGGANAFPHVIVATPGRLVDLCKPQPPSKSKLRRDPQAVHGPPALLLSSVKCLILDEADRMLDLGFKPQLSELARLIDGQRDNVNNRYVNPKNGQRGASQRQTLCFSATWPNHVHAAAKMFLGPSPVQIDVASACSHAEARKFVVEERIVQEVQILEQDQKPAALRKIISCLDPNSSKIIVFSSRKQTCDHLAAQYSKPSFPLAAAALHSNLSQAERLQIVKDFRCSKVRLLFATDVVARGLNVLDINLVINYDFPVQRGLGGVEEYVHRIGRTGRAGNYGRAITFFTKDDSESAADFVMMLSQSRTKPKIPSELRRMATANENSEAVQLAKAKRKAKKERKKRTKEVRPGDWRCKCGANVFAKKKNCFKCGAAKQESEQPMFGNVSFS